MANRAHWDSKKEYEKFWNPGSSGKARDRNYHNLKKKRWSGCSIFFVIVVGLIAAIGLGTSSLKLRQAADHISSSIVMENPDSIPDFSGDDYVILNDNFPNFQEQDLQEITGEIYSDLDRLGRCGAAVAMLDRSMMPTGKRENIGQIKPTGWVQAKYPGYVNSEPPYLYNRCHLIAYGLTGQNANEKNLITGTRYFNAAAMLPFEEQVMKYLDHSDHHVLYRVTPYFKGKELVARGVEMEAYSVEDKGKGICYHVFVYNYQPGIEIDYQTGESCIIR